MKRMTYFVMAFALVLGFTQCKKEQVNTPENETKTVNITLNVGGNDGSRHTIDTENGDVDFQDGDVIYVGDGSTYIGTLTRNGGVFSGSINEPNDGTEIYFYFVGGLTPSATLEAGTTPSFTVDISNQSTKMPVLSCNHVTYHPGTTSYSCKLENQCALVKFTTASTTAPVHVGGLYTRAMIDFDNNSITNNGTTGFVALNSKSATEKWAVLLPQTGFEDAEAAIAHVGYTTTIPTIAADGFITGDAAISISTLSNIVYLDWLTEDYTATDGKILTGTLAGDYKINVNADGATVTLKDATITGTNHEAYSWAGITCENNTTLVIEGANSVTGFYENYPGIFIASGKTLTIEGNGSLDVSSNGGANGWGAGIGSNDVADCGNIVINSGTISATGGIWMAGIGCGYAQNCGYITINGGTVTATGGPGAAGIGLGYTITDITCGDISITGGIVNATGGLGAAGIGSGFVVNNNHNQCGDISITGGQVTATGGDGGDSAYDILKKDSWVDMPYYGGAGIGTGSTVISDAAGYSDCGTINIGSGVTSVTATKGGGTHPATNSIGKNHSSGSGTCGTITIGGTEYPSGATPNQSDGLTFVYPAPAPVIPEGAINSLFSVSANKQVYFSQGNLQATTSDLGVNWTWAFATNQWDYIGNAAANNAINGNGTVSTNGTIDLFGWSTAATYYGINNSGSDADYHGTFVDWGGLTIGSAAPGTWRTLSNTECTYLLNDRTTTSGIRYAKAKVNNVCGVILLPDNWNSETYTLSTYNITSANYTSNEISETDWNNSFAPNGAVFLPAAGFRGATFTGVGTSGYYWSSMEDTNNTNKAYMMNFSASNFFPSRTNTKRYGNSVRLVSDAN